ncbi:Aste57867_4563 [Aphanomyces stellatus]|uniref:Aste57867_4563 protein n=1 Tax=Aphanomyces stellatus TaxID=120398 RepID=A0A485KBY8_9STRA|nr:hypothetical protein As57867_004550 [Aphanomyces stellatus]VFT81669.1 Aste57867_4563 [Aphanomyces stellatus]
MRATSRPRVVELLSRLQVEIQDLVESGFQVFVATVNPQGEAFRPVNMLSGDSVGSVAPVIRSIFRQQHQTIISLVGNTIAAANETLVDYSDNQCFDDVCQVVSMREGGPVNFDSHHFRYYFARTYVASLDRSSYGSPQSTMKVVVVPIC